jgi:hypothetical protein
VEDWDFPLQPLGQWSGRDTMTRNLQEPRSLQPATFTLCPTELSVRTIYDDFPIQPLETSIIILRMSQNSVTLSQTVSSLKMI